MGLDDEDIHRMYVGKNMIQIKINICWTVLFNNTKYEWHELQNDIKEYIDINNITLHCTSRTFNKKPDMIFKDETVALHIKYNPESRMLEFICIEHNGFTQ